MTTHRLSLLLCLPALLIASGCGRYIISPRDLVSENPVFTATEKKGDLELKAKLLDEKDLLRLFENNAKNSIFSFTSNIFKDHYSVALLTLRNRGPKNYMVRVINSDLPAKSELMPRFSYNESSSYNRYYPYSGINTMYWWTSNNGLSKKDAQTLKSYALFSDYGRNSIHMTAYSKQVRLVFMDKKTGNTTRKVKMTIQEGGQATSEKVVLRI